MTNEMTLEEVREVGVKRSKETFSRENGNTIIRALRIHEKRWGEDSFSADTISLIAKRYDTVYGKDCEIFAEHIAYDMRTHSGTSCKYEIEDIVHKILSRVEWAQSRSSKLPS